MDPLLRLLRELWELRDVPIITDREIEQLADEGQQLIHEEARAIERQLGID